MSLFLRLADGNEADKAVFGQIAKGFSQRINFESLIVSDSALYSKDNLLIISGISWLCRVPFSIKEAKHLASTVASKDLIKSRIPGYSWWEFPSRYGGVEQRWLLVESQKRKAADLERLENKIQQELTQTKKKLHQLSGREFETQQGALEITKEVSKKLKYHKLTELQIRLFLSILPVKKGQGKKKKRLSLPFIKFNLTYS